MMCGWQAALRGRKVCIIEHTQKIGEKIRISGGGRCNFTNMHTGPDNFLSQNPHFCKSALARFTPYDFLDMVQKHDIPYHEKPYDEGTSIHSQGQLFCDKSAGDIIDMLRFGIENNEGIFALSTTINTVKKSGGKYKIKTDKGDFSSDSLVVASGGLSIPKIGATKFGYELAKQFGLSIIPTRAALVPLRFDEKFLEKTKDLSGISLLANASCHDGNFTQGLLFTHRGMSGPTILQVSSYWHEGEAIRIDLAPGLDFFEHLKQKRIENPKQQISTILSESFASKLSALILTLSGIEGRIGDLSDDKLRNVSNIVNRWEITPHSTEGYRTAEVTLGGVNTDEVSSKTFEAKKSEGLYFIGEVLDVTGHLGGHNFQWAWSSGWCAGQVV